MALAITDRRILPQTFSDMGQVASLKRARSTWFLLACIFGFGFLAAGAALAVGVGLYTTARADNVRLAELQQRAEGQLREYRPISDIRNQIRSDREDLFNDINDSRSTTRDRLWQKAQTAWRDTRPPRGDVLEMPGQSPSGAWQETHPQPGRSQWESQIWASASRDTNVALQAELDGIHRAQQAVDDQQAIDGATPSSSGSSHCRDDNPLACPTP
jgi:hypothetical protein